MLYILVHYRIIYSVTRFGFRYSWPFLSLRISLQAHYSYNQQMEAKYYLQIHADVGEIK